ncbi:MAG: hypothetical protein LBC99_10010 [Spirochaetota bacterium]|jgi:hypothetical protein|nr:hypothetical protein [Spirochaetota bacterium]
MRSVTVIRKEGMDCLLKSLGVLETEVFISSLIRENFDYTEWQRKYFSDQPLDDFLGKAKEYDQKNPFGA